VSQNENGFKLSNGAKTHKIILFESDREPTAKLVSYLWGWLPYKIFKGRISATGIAVIERNIGRFI
jgi:hypothetical protein